MDRLDELEAQSVYIFREAFERLRKLGLLWSLGKDSNVMIWLARKAFFGRVPFPVMHVDTGKKFTEMYDFRDRYSKEWGVDLIVEPCPPIEAVDPTLPPAARSAARKTEGLKLALSKHGFDGLFVGIRRDEEATRAKERVFSPRGVEGIWDVRDQPPEFWNHFNASPPPGAHLRVHPILHWTELDIWNYTRREGIPIIPLYLARDGKRYRSLGDADITFPIESNAMSIDEIIVELEFDQGTRTVGTCHGPRVRGCLRATPSHWLSLKNVSRGKLPAMNIALKEPLQSSAPSGRPLVRIVIVGHVDHGKSTLIGRLLHETGSLPDGKLDTLKAISASRGMDFEWSFLLDALQTERDLGITIDTSQIRFRTEMRDFVLIDAPGHTEFLRNMITGAAQADAAILIVDAGEGMREQTRRHGYLLHLLGVRQIAVVINKMDRVNYDFGRYDVIRAEIQSYLEGLGLTPTAVIPISARHGDGVAKHNDKTRWYDGPTVLEALDSFSSTSSLPELALRLPVQAVYKFDDRRIIAGRIETGRIAVGDEIVVAPGGKLARVSSIEAWPALSETPVRSAAAGQSIGITLDRELFVDRGHLISLQSSPAETCRMLRARIFWLHHSPLQVGARVLVRIGTAETNGVVRVIDNIVDPGQIAAVSSDAIEQNHVGEIEISLARALAADPYAINPTTGRVVLEFGGRIAGGGLVLALAPADDSKSVSDRIKISKGEHPLPSAPVSLESLSDLADRLSGLCAGQTAAERLHLLRKEIVGRIVFTTSFGLEDQVIAHLLWQHGIDVDVVTLDTGRLFQETYAVWVETERRYGIHVRAYYPRRGDLEDLVARDGINGFYDSKAARLACCHVRKIEPLAPASPARRSSRTPWRRLTREQLILTNRLF